MNKFRVFYILSLVILILLLILPTYFIFKPTSSEDSISLTSENEFLEIGKTISFAFSHYNHESEDKNYTIVIFLNDKEISNLTRTVKNHSYLKYLGLFEDSENIRGTITVLIYKEGESEPIDKVTYSLRFKNSTA